MRRLDEFPQQLVDAAMVHEAFRRLGFDPAHIFLTVVGGAHSRQPTTLMGIRLPSGEKFDIDLGFPFPDDGPARWAELCNAINATQVSDRDLEDAWESSRVARRLPTLAQRIQAKGILVPNRTWNERWN